MISSCSFWTADWLVSSCLFRLDLDCSLFGVLLHLRLRQSPPPVCSDLLSAPLLEDSCLSFLRCSLLRFYLLTDVCGATAILLSGVAAGSDFRRSEFPILSAFLVSVLMTGPSSTEEKALRSIVSLHDGTSSGGSDVWRSEFLAVSTCCVSALQLGLRRLRRGHSGQSSLCAVAHPSVDLEHYYWQKVAPTSLQPDARKLWRRICTPHILRGVSGTPLGVAHMAALPLVTILVLCWRSFWVLHSDGIRSVPRGSAWNGTWSECHDGIHVIPSCEFINTLIF